MPIIPPASPASLTATKIEYTPELDRVLCETGEECELFSKLHLMAYKKFRQREVMFNLPIITITALIGFVSGLKLEFEYIHLILGGLSLYASLMKSYFSYLKISQKSENHRIAYIQYDQIHTGIRLELSLHPSIRKEASMLVDIMRIKLKNLREVSEIIDNSIIKKYVSELKRGEMREMVEVNKINRIKQVMKQQEDAAIAARNPKSQEPVLTLPPPQLVVEQPPQFRRSQQVALKLSSPIQTYAQLQSENVNITQSEREPHPKPIYCDYPEYSVERASKTNSTSEDDDSESETDSKGYPRVRGTCV